MESFLIASIQFINFTKCISEQNGNCCLRKIDVKKNTNTHKWHEQITKSVLKSNFYLKHVLFSLILLTYMDLSQQKLYDVGLPMGLYDLLRLCLMLGINK